MKRKAPGQACRWGETLASTAVLNSKANEGDRLKKGGLAFLCLSAFYVVYCGRPEDWFHGMGLVPWAKVTGAAAVLAFLLGPQKGRRKFRDLPVEAHLLLALIVILGFSSLFSPIWKGGALRITSDFAKVWVIWVLTFLLVTDLQKFRRIVFIQAVSVVLVCVLSIVKGRHHERLEGVLGGIYSNSNDLAFAIALSIPLCFLFLLTTKSRFRKLLWAGGLLVMCAALFLTASRAGFITLIFTAGIALWHFGVKGKRFYLIVVSGVAAMVLLMVAGETMQERFIATWSDKSELETREQYRALSSFEERQFLIDRALEGLKEYPILGMGPKNFEVYSGVWLEVHMAYLQIAVEGGIPSLILFLLFFYCGFRNLRKLMRRKDLNPEIKLFTGALQSLLVGFVVGALFAPEAYQFFPFFAVCYTSVLLACIREADRANTARKPVTQPFAQLISPVQANVRVPVNT